MQHPHTNALIHETSPYLLQHAHNPVNWHPWGEEALQKARSEDKIILVSIGYAACHWCHVMERESFENEDTAAIMNRHFINIKIDREERPDLDHIYMDAVQAMTGSGGWPLNVFLTPDAKPFYGGTYFPPVKAFNRSRWKEVLHGVAQSWKERKTEIEAQAENLLIHLQQANNFGGQKGKITGIENETVFTGNQCHAMFQAVMKTADTTWGGIGKAPKFPQTFNIQWLLQYHHFSGNKTALKQALLSLDKMIDGGIYDQAGGGFSRYSTDEEWLAPHFEKMLYDNAYLLNILADAFAITKDKKYSSTIRQTIGFLQREMYDPEGGFYAALDADSEGEEGKFYVWERSAIETILQTGAGLFCDFFDVREGGNWEHKNILRKLQNVTDFAKKNELNPDVFEQKMDACLDILLRERNNRIRPATDDKILLGWNALLVTALCKTAAALNENSYKELAIQTFSFIQEKFSSSDGALLHTYKNGIAKYPAFLDDYAYVIQAAINLQEISSDNSYLSFAKQMTEFTIEHFSDTASAFFFYTGKDQQDVVLRKKEIYDGATASGNSVMADNLFYLGIVFNNPTWTEKAQQMLLELSSMAERYPGSFAVWGSGILKQVTGWNEIAIVGEGFEEKRRELLNNFIPNKIVQCANTGDEKFPLLAGKNGAPEAQFFLCRNYSCLQPVSQIGELKNIIRVNDKI